MIVWRGLGILVPIIGAVALFAWIAVTDTLGKGVHPELDYARDLYERTHPVMAYGVLAGLAGVAAILTWFIGAALNRNGGGHTFFFVPMQFWALAFLGIGGFAGYYGTSTDQIAGARTEFIRECADHEVGADEEKCTCLADTSTTGVDQDVALRFWVYMAEAWGDDDADEDNVIPHFIADETQGLSDEQAAALTETIYSGGVCFG